MTFDPNAADRLICLCSFDVTFEHGFNFMLIIDLDGISDDLK